MFSRSEPVDSPDMHPNIRLFILFRLLFNARFYYPVYTVLFLDMGLSLEQFFILYAVWAGTIFLLEVPSGAIADTFGRRNLVLIAGCCMILEMAVISFIPLANHFWLFIGLLCNRVLSGIAEAMASGADEALAFDTLKEQGREMEWPRVLDLQMRCQSAAFVVAMLSGAALYDARSVNFILDLVSINLTLDPVTTMRFPLYLCLATAVLATFCAWRMREVKLMPDIDSRPGAGGAFQLVGRTAKWVIGSPVVLMILIAFLTFDSTARLVITLVSEYYRAIHIPEFAFGIMGATVGLIGLFVPIWARRLVERRNPFVAWSVLAVVLGLAVSGMALMIPWWGVLPAMGIGMSLMLGNFFSSHYLNRAIDDSRRRATVLSFRSLVSNLALGLVGLLYMVFTMILSRDKDSSVAAIGETTPVFRTILLWTPFYYALTLAGLIFILYILRQRTGVGRHIS